MKQPVRAFSFGLFTAGVILLVIVLFFDKSQETPKLSQKEMIASLEENGMQVLTDEEYISFSVKEDSGNKDEQKSETQEKEQPKESVDQENKDNQEKEEVKTFTLNVEPGLASSSISDILEENGIIDSASKFNQYLEENDYSQYVQLGTFKVTSDMTFNQLAETITNEVGGGN